MSFEFSITPDLQGVPSVAQNGLAEDPPIDPSLVALSPAQADGQALQVEKPLNEDPLSVNSLEAKEANEGMQVPTSAAQADSGLLPSLSFFTQDPADPYFYYDAASSPSTSGAGPADGIEDKDDPNYVGGTLGDDALSKVPHVGNASRPFRLDGQRLGRASMISEYIRRKTGQIRESRRVNARLNGTLAIHAATNPRLAHLLTGTKFDLERDASRDWNAVLGADLYPHTKAAHDAATKAMNEKDQKSRSKRPSVVARRLAATGAQVPDKALHAIGLDTIDALVDLISADDHLADVLLANAVERARLSGTEAGWARKALSRLRSSFAAGTD
ncbi:hypothetical protein JCM8097_003772 [Rhodosporidiobolus ruineniae]